MFKKILYLSFAIFMILFMWSVNSSFNVLKNKNIMQEVYLYKNSSESLIKEYKGLEFFVKGESIKINGEENVNDILKYYGAEIIFTEQTEQGKSYYAFSKKLKYQKRLNGHIINLHIFIGNNRTVIGSPIIYGSY